MTRQPKAIMSLRAIHSPRVGDAGHKDNLTKEHDQRGIILSILFEFLEDDNIGDLDDWIDHVGFDLTAIRDPADLPAAWLGHYHRGRGYDVDRALNDLLTWPPIAARIAFLSKNSQPTVAVPRGPTKRRPQKPAG